MRTFLFLIFYIRKIIPDFGLYRDDGLGVAKFSGSLWNANSKKLHAAIKKFGFSITIEFGMKTTDFLDVLFNLEDGSYKPYNKPNH